MPELPEVEVSRLGIAPHIEGQVIDKIVVRQRQLRWPIPMDIHDAEGLPISAVTRRAKYLFLTTQKGSIVLHLGMSGTLRVVNQNTPIKNHDHLDIVMANGACLRLNDPRRFGACLWQQPNEQLKQLSALGPEPLTDAFNGETLYLASRNKQCSVKTLIMNNQVVVGVGNIYASESLFMAGINPIRKAGNISKQRYIQLAAHIKTVLSQAIAQGGTTLKDFTNADGKPGYFAQKLLVYGRNGKNCYTCGTSIRSRVIGQRNTYYCPRCQR